jgi:hypothetical protein
MVPRLISLLGVLLPLASAAAPSDLAPARDKLLLLTDGKSHYVAVQPFDSVDNPLFYGDGKRFFAVPYQSRSSNGTQSFSFVFVDPRHFRSFHFDTEVQLRDGKYSVRCSSHETPMTVVEPAAAKALLAAATFEPSPRKWQAYALARDPSGVYYYVDHGRTPETSKHFRLFVGPKGNLKQQKMTNVVSDSEGDIFATKTGSMRLILDKKESSWMASKKTTPLRLVPVEDNLGVIYNELGVYTGERMGTPCDDL